MWPLSISTTQGSPYSPCLVLGTSTVTQLLLKARTPVKVEGLSVFLGGKTPLFSQKKGDSGIVPILEASSHPGSPTYFSVDILTKAITQP